MAEFSACIKPLPNATKPSQTALNLVSASGEGIADSADLSFRGDVVGSVYGCESEVDRVVGYSQWDLHSERDYGDYLFARKSGFRPSSMQRRKLMTGWDPGRDWLSSATQDLQKWARGRAHEAHERVGKPLSEVARSQGRHSCLFPPSFLLPSSFPQD